MPNNQGGLTGIESISGIQPATTSAVEKITLLNTDYDYSRTASINNQTNFLSLTAQHTTVKFDSRNFDINFNDGNNVGLNPFFTAPETATKIFTA